MEEIYLRQDLKEEWYAIPTNIVHRFEADLLQINYEDNITLQLDMLDRFDDNYYQYKLQSLASQVFILVE